MRNFAKCLIGVGAALVLTAGAYAQAFQYSTDINGAVLPTVIPVGTALLTITPAQPPSNGFAGGLGTDIVLANYEVTTDPTGNQPVNVPYTINAFIKSTNTGITYNKAIQCTLSGSLDPGQANIVNTVNSGLPWTFVDGGLPWNVSFVSFTPIGPQNAPTKGALAAHVTCVPEPSSLALAGIGLLPMLGFIRRRK